MITDRDPGRRPVNRLRTLVLPVLAALTLVVVSATGRAAPVEERRTLTREEQIMVMQSMRASSLVAGATVTACWFDDGSTFWFPGGEGPLFVDPATKEMRALTDTERMAWKPDVPRGRGGQVHAPGDDRYTVIDDGNIRLFEAGASEGKTLTDDAEEDLAWSVTAAGWSPDGTRICAVRIDTRAVHHLPIVDFSKPEETVEEVPYGKTGGGFMKQEIAIFDAATGQKVAVDTGDAGDVYLFLVGWRNDGSEILFFRLTRNARRLDLLAADATTGKSRKLLTELSKTFVAGLDFITRRWQQTLVLLEKSDRFLWLSERDGWRHIYLYDRDGNLIRRLTEGAFPVLEIVACDEEAGRVFFLANGEERLYDTNLYSVGLDGEGFRRLTDGIGKHRVQMSPAKDCFVDTWSTPTVPPKTVLRNADGELLLTLAEADISRLEGSGWIPPEEFVVKADDGETDLYGILYKPRGFDPAKKYPVIDFVYAGPFTTVVPHEFASGSFMAARARAMAQLGFAAFVVDGRGTTERGKAFQDASYGRIGTIEIPDHLACLKQIAADRPWIDLDRVGVTGTSWGGYFALRAMLTAPGVYHVGIAIAPGALTESPPINEPYMNLPKQNPTGYANGSNPPLAGNLKGRLLLVHGTADVNAPFSTTMRMVAALVKAGKLHDLAVLPGAGHHFRGADGMYSAELTISYFREHLLGE